MFLQLRYLLFAVTLFSCIVSKETYEKDDCMKYAKEKFVHGAQVHGLLFVPEDEVKKAFVGLIHHEKRSIRAAAYQLTDTHIIKALVDAHNRGIHVEVIVDKSCLVSKYEKITALKRKGVRVFVFKSNYLMHHKFWVFGHNLGNRPLCVHGSANPTDRGTKFNEEDVRVDDNLSFVTKFYYKFERLKKKIAVMRYITKQKILGVSRATILALLRKIPK